MKKIFITLLLTISLVFWNYIQANANCWWVLENGLNNWTVASNCTISNGLYSVWWVIDVNSRTVTISSNAALVVDWTNDKMTFTTGKVNMSWNAAMYDALQHPYTPYTATSWVTNCPSGTNVYNPIVRGTATTKVNASHNGRLICK